MNEFETIKGKMYNELHNPLWDKITNQIPIQINDYVDDGTHSLIWDYMHTIKEPILRSF